MGFLKFTPLAATAFSRLALLLVQWPDIALESNFSMLKCKETCRFSYTSLTGPLGIRSLHLWRRFWDWKVCLSFLHCRAQAPVLGHPLCWNSQVNGSQLTFSWQTQVGANEWENVLPLCLIMRWLALTSPLPHSVSHGQDRDPGLDSSLEGPRVHKRLLSYSLVPSSHSSATIESIFQ